jgi:hypothetical protein
MRNASAASARPPAVLRLIFAGAPSASTHDMRPGASWCRPSGELEGRAFISASGGCIVWRGLGAFTFTRGSDDVVVHPEPGVDAASIAREFPGTAEPIILQGLGWHVLHASAALAPRGGVLTFCGASGSGKSTLAYAMQLAGHVQFADDSVVLSRPARDLVAWPRVFAPSLRPASRDHFNRHPVRVRTFPRPRLEACPVRAIFLVRQDAGLAEAVTAAVVPKARAFAALLPHAHAIDASAGSASRDLVEFYLAVVESTPVIDLAYRPDLSRIGRLVDAVVDAATRVS